MGIKSAGFLHLFDWNKKTRKNLFATGTVSPDLSKQDPKDNADIKLTDIKDDDTEELNDNSFASSIVDGEVKGSRAPSVVARLMGLDSFPTSGLSEPCSMPLFHSQSLLQNFYQQRVPEITIGGKLNSSRRMPSSMIERFSTEMRPARSLPIPHHKLLLPIKNPSFSTGKNAAHVTEAAVKILEPGLGDNSKGKAHSLETSRKPLHLDDSLNMTRSENEESCSAKASSEWEETSSTSARYNRRSVSLAVQAKVNVQRREGLSVPRLRGEIKPILKNRVQKNASKPGALRQNTQKLNGLSSKEKITSNSTLSNPQTKRVPSEDAKSWKNRTPKKIQANPKVLHKKEDFRRGSNPQKKRLINGKNRSKDSTLADPVIVGSHEKRGEENSRNGTQIVSFTFTSPMIKSFKGSQSNSPIMHDWVSSSNLNVISSDALTVLLEKKLKELSQELKLSADVENASVSTPDSASISEKETVEEMSTCNIADELPSVSGRLFNQSSTPEATESKKPGQQHLSPQSILEATFSSESCSSSSESCNGSRPETKIAKIDLSDSASSKMPLPPAAPLSELEYITRLVNCWDLNAGVAERSLDPQLFDLSEEEILTAGGKMDRKAVFDCVEEWLTSRRQRNLESGGSVRFLEKEELAEQICRDLNLWRGMGDWMVDELVTVDMGFGSGRWVEFPEEVSEVVVKMEKFLLCNLLDEVLCECRIQ